MNCFQVDHSGDMAMFNNQFWDGRNLGILLIMLVAYVIATRANAEVQRAESYSSLDEVGTGTLLSKKGLGQGLGQGHVYQAFDRTSAKFDVDISGLVASVRLQQTFSNTSSDWTEAIYVLPLMDNSAVHAMRIVVGERVIEGQIKERSEAKRSYTQAKKQGKKTGLLEQNRPNLFTAKVANIAPGESVSIELNVLQPLHFDAPGFELRLPMTLTPRYIPGKNMAQETKVSNRGWAQATDQVSDAPSITPPQYSTGQQNVATATLEIDLDSGFEVAEFVAPYHSVEVAKEGDNYKVFPSGKEVTMDRDFVLRWKPVASQLPIAAYFSETVKNKIHGLIMVMPPAAQMKNSIPPRELSLVIDTSGSMAGMPMDQAKQALLYAITKLRPQDKFNITQFDSAYGSLFSRSRFATGQNLRLARGFIAGLQADGGTEMYAPLKWVLSDSTRVGENGESEVAEEPFYHQVVFITDGSVGNEDRLFKLIEDNIHQSRLYTVGIGSAPNSYFMRRAAQFGRGTYTFIGKPEEVKQNISQLFSDIKSPVLTQVELEFDGTDVEFYPELLPDLYLGKPLLVSARFDQQPQSYTVTGQLYGSPWSTTVDVSDANGSDGREDYGVATLWARDKVASLRDDAIRNGVPALNKQAIMELGLSYNLVTPYTSFVAVDVTPARPRSLPPSTNPVPNPMPFGSTQNAPSVGYPNTGLGLNLSYLFALVFLLAAVLAWGKRSFLPVGGLE